MVLTKASLTRGATAWLALLALVGCAGTRLGLVAPRAEATLVTVLDLANGTSTELPATARDALVLALAAEGVTGQLTAAPAELAKLGDTTQRLAHLAAASPGVKHLVLVECRAVFTSLVAGAYRWGVACTLSWSERGERAATYSEAVTAAAALRYDHEREPEALEQSANVLGARLQALARRVLGEAPRLTQTVGEPRATANAGTAWSPATDVIYFVLVDRFVNGNPDNDGEVNPRDPIAWHGGDLAGITAKLDDLKALGARTLWLSPLSQSQTKPFFGHGAFHGYWPIELAALEPRFGTLAELQALREAMRERGMQLVLDMVVNHLGYEAPLVKERPAFFHKRGEIKDWSDPVQLETHDVHGLPDLAQEKPEVYAMLMDAARAWLSRAAPDGFRLDAVRHVAREFWKHYLADVDVAAGPRFRTLGELYDGNPAKVATLQREAGFTHMLDFPFYYALVDSVCEGKTLERLGAVLAADRLYERPEHLVTFADNHDLPRIASVCPSTLIEAALAMLYVSRGTPAITYGTEHGLEGEHEPDNRRSYPLLPHHVPAPYAPFLRAFAGVRGQLPVLYDGATRVLDADAGHLEVLRWKPDGAALVVVSRDEAKPRVVPASLLPAKPTIDAKSKLNLRVYELDAGAVGDLAKPCVQRVQVRVEGAPAGANVVVAGLGPELGNWEPKNAPRATTASAQTSAPATVTLDLPAPALHELKLVAMTASAPTWEPRGNRYIQTRCGEPGQALTLDWGR